MAGVDVVGTHKFLREFNAFSVGVRLSVPPAVLIEGAEGVDQDHFPVGAQGKFLLPIDVDQAVLGRFPLDVVNGEGCGTIFSYSSSVMFEISSTSSRPMFRSKVSNLVVTSTNGVKFHAVFAIRCDTERFCREFAARKRHRRPER